MDLGIVAADLHLAPTTWQRHPTLTGDTYFALRQIVDQCLARRLPLFLLGDIFDKQRPDSLSVRKFCDEMNRMQAAGLPVSYIQGNHDDAVTPWPAVHDWPRWVHQQSFTLGSFNCYGLDFQPRGRLAEALAAVPAETHILLAHQAWEELQGIGNTDGSFAQVHQARYLLTGDYHVCLNQDGQSATGLLTVYSPGSTCLQAINESLPKNCLLLAESPPGCLAVVPLPLYTRPLQSYRIETEADLVPVVAALAGMPLLTNLPEEISKPIVRVRFRDSVPDVFERLTAAADGKYHLFLEPQHASGEVVEVSLATYDPAARNSFDTLESGLAAMRATGAIDESLYNDAVRLLRSPDRKGEIVTMYEEFLNAPGLTGSTFRALGPVAAGA